MEPIRLQKFMSDSGVLSRRAAEVAISEGKITVNRKVAVIGQKIDPQKDIVMYNGEKVTPRKNNSYIYIALNKPRGYVTSLSDEKGRKCVTDLLTDLNQRVYPIGRLDLNSEGLLLLTNDGELTHKLTHPKHSIPKHYKVQVRGFITEEQLAALNGPMEIDGYTIKPVLTKLLTVGDSTTTLKMRLFEGRNRQIRKMCELQGLEVARLKRLAIGSIELANLEPGKWRYLSPFEIDYLFNA